MNDYQYFLMISHVDGGWEDVEYNFEENDEPINVICGNTDYNAQPDSMNDYFIIQTFKGKAYLFQYMPEPNIQNGQSILTTENFTIDHIACSYNFIFISSGCGLYIYSFDKNTFKITLEARYQLPSPVIKMKPASTSFIAVFVQLQDYSLKMLRQYNRDSLIDIASNVLLFDVCMNSLVYLNTNLMQVTINYQFTNDGEIEDKNIIEIKTLPVNIYSYYNEYEEKYRCLYEWNQGILDIQSDILKDNIPFSACAIGDKIIYCNQNRSAISLLEEPDLIERIFFETDDQIIAFSEFIGSKDLIILKRQCSTPNEPPLYHSYYMETITLALDQFNIITGTMETPITTYFDSVNIFNSLFTMLKPDLQILTVKGQSITQLLLNIIDFQNNFTNIFKLSQILVYQFFETLLQDFSFRRATNTSYSCLASLIDKAIKITPCKLSPQSLCKYRTDKNGQRPLLMPPLRKQFNEIHYQAMCCLSDMPEYYVEKTLTSLLSCLRYTTCNLVQFAIACHKFRILGVDKELTLYLIRRLLASGYSNPIELPDIVKILLFAYSWIRMNDPQSDLLKKIVDFFEYRPDNEDYQTASRINDVFNDFLSRLQPKLEELFNEIRFYPEDIIIRKIVDFLIIHLPFPVNVKEFTNRYKNEVATLAKSGAVLRIKIAYINTIHEADDFITLCRSSHLARRTGNT
ncbi:hypothetical protein TRFO_10772 [Tritrichomonas foetus]|uniref:Uncharacterized protein n=1 Tax=Tritrichomonas foetus TaxID=1144522 RepID=A0A1J4J6K6_9EUKA|nr:hypothetical protein TRFO_10772 [Tritrichomonas foetus]|eukprot:OHS94858.1 hypothetical protein TRFO_10772 [Tritrichomonas foetus]